MGVRERFVRDILEEEGERMLRNQGQAMRSAVRFQTGSMFSDREIRVTTGEDYDGKMEFKHVDYERFLDIKRLRRGSSTVKSNKKIHNRFVFGTYGAIAGRLMYDFTEDVADRIRAQSKDI